MAFAAGQRLTAQLMNETFRTPSANTQIATGTTTSTVYTATLTGGTTCSTTFTAPASGKINVFNTAQALNSGAADSLCSFEIRLGPVVGSGTVFLAASDDNAVINTGTASGRMTVSNLITGLTPNTVYNIRQLFRVVSGTGTFLRKNIVILPTV